MSFDRAASPSITLSSWGAEHSGPRSGWGFAWYPADENAVQLVREPGATGDTSMTEVLRDWDRFRSSLFLCHVRGAAQFRTLENTQPFQRSFGGRDWAIVHSGNLDPARARGLEVGGSAAFEPVGRTDTEHAFCWILSRASAEGKHSLSAIGWETLHGWFRELNAIGTLNVLLTDGEDLVVYRDEEAFGELYVLRRTPPHANVKLVSEPLELEFDDPTDTNLTMILVATTPLSNEPWIAVPAGSLFVARRGAVTFSSSASLDPVSRTLSPSAAAVARPEPIEQLQMAPEVLAPSPTAWSQTQPQQSVAAVGVDHGAPLSGTPPQTELCILHETTYTYSIPVEKSVSTLRLKPVEDAQQALVDYDLQLSVDGAIHEYLDVFGNAAAQLTIDRPYTELRIRARSRVRVYQDSELYAPGLHSSLPLVWMPWQRQMMVPYLLPPELPESQLRELTDYAMSFAKRQDNELVATLLDINSTIRRDFTYLSRSTHLGTTPFDVYVHRRGVCQDFANLFICLARLVNVPARYRVGYIYTGASYENQIQSEASHAWVEVYLPLFGWRGLDPTNGCLANADHVRIATGRNYRDATPTSGTIFKGGGHETLNVSVQVEPAQNTGGA